MYKKFLVLSLLFALCFWLSCRVDPYVPTSSKQVAFDIPKGWPQPYYQFTNNRLTYDGFQLGRRLFYDGRLSSNDTVSCAFCHQNFAAFSNLAHFVSHGVGNQNGTRNAPGIFNMAWNTSYFWDGGVTNLENQPINPMTNPVEMGETLPDVIRKISKDPMYPAMFQRAFSNDTGDLINSKHIFQSLAQFMAVMISNNSRYDSFVRGQITFNSSETNGYTTFKTKCASCHSEPLFSDYQFRSIGLEPEVMPVINHTGQFIIDSGREHITHNASDRYKFKTPSLRNIALTAPYMHDGRFLTLLDVLDYFSTSIKPGASYCATLDPSLTGGIPLTTQQKNDLISFLNTLTDHTLYTNPLFSDPNNYPAP
ncbi:MAG: cytochrome c peroxidase [Flavipsychrobacter sp.]|nr:cytochrome c peroxidase [Flavipsychrobacter sp.]